MTDINLNTDGEAISIENVEFQRTDEEDDTTDASPYLPSSSSLTESFTMEIDSAETDPRELSKIFNSPIVVADGKVIGFLSDE